MQMKKQKYQTIWNRIEDQYSLLSNTFVHWKLEYMLSIPSYSLYTVDIAHEWKF